MCTSIFHATSSVFLWHLALEQCLIHWLHLSLGIKYNWPRSFFFFFYGSLLHHHSDYVSSDLALYCMLHNLSYDACLLVIYLLMQYWIGDGSTWYRNELTNSQTEYLRLLPWSLNVWSVIKQKYSYLFFVFVDICFHETSIWFFQLIYL